MLNRCPRVRLRRKPMPPHRWPRHRLMPNVRLVALPAERLLPLLLLEGPPPPLRVGLATPPAPVRHRTPSKAKHMHRGRMNGMPPPAQTDAATCASRTPTPCAAMGTKRRAHPQKDEEI